MTPHATCVNCSALSNPIKDCAATVPLPPAARLLDDWLELEDFAREEVKRHPRTVRRWTKSPDGLPYAMLGKTPLIHVPTAREWLLGRLHRPNQRQLRKRAARI